MKRVHQNEPDTWSARIEKQARLTLEPVSEDPLGDALRAACRRGPHDELSNQPVLISGSDAVTEEHMATLAYWPRDAKIGRAVIEKIESSLWQFMRGDESDMATSAADEYTRVCDAMFCLSDEQERGTEGEPCLPGLFYQLCRTFDVDALADIGAFRLVSLVAVPEKFLCSRVHRAELHTFLHTVDVDLTPPDWQ